MMHFAKRNLKLFFKDKSGVFFSLLGVLIVVALFAFFLGDMYVESMEGLPEGESVINSWMIAGILAITSMTTGMGACNTMVDDRTKNINKDFFCTPIKRSSLTMGYILSAYTIGLIMTLLTAVLGEIYLVSQGCELLSPMQMIQALGVILLTTLSNTAMILLIVSCMRSASAFSTASAILSTMIGFLTGIYIPVGNFTDAIQIVIKIFPTTHGAILLRQIFTEDAMAVSFAGIPEQTVTEFEEMMGIVCTFGDITLSTAASIGILVGSTVLFSVLAWILSNRKKVK